MVIAPPVPATFLGATPLDDAAPGYGVLRDRVVLRVGAGDQAYWGSADEVDGRLAARMLAAWQVSARTHRLDESLRTAATALAVERVGQAHQQRGLYP